LFLYVGPFRRPRLPGGGSAAAAYRLVDGHGEVVSQRLVARQSDYMTTLVDSYRDGFVVFDEWHQRATHVAAHGAETALEILRRPTPLKPGDLFMERVGRFFRPSTRTLIAPALPPGASGTHVDGHGVVWTVGRPEDGQTVVYSATPGAPWTKHVVGPYSSWRHGCVCDIGPGPRGRGSVLVVTGDRWQHVSTDYGRTWTTYGLSTTAPYRAVLDRRRYPIVSALPDGRAVIGYTTTGYWVATDPCNTSFSRVGQYPPGLIYRAGIGLSVMHRPNEISVDGGQTWLRYP
jgi:hypothetical protein